MLYVIHRNIKYTLCSHMNRDMKLLMAICLCIMGFLVHVISVFQNDWNTYLVKWHGIRFEAHFYYKKKYDNVDMW